MDKPLRDLVVEKLRVLLGAERAPVVFREVLAEARLAEIGDAQDLLTFGEALQRRGGVEGAVGSILGFQALLRGARKPDSAAAERTADETA